MLLELIFVLVVVFFGYFFLTQILFPLLNGTKLFSFFGKRRLAQKDLTEAKEDRDVARIEDETKKIRKKI